MKMILGHKAEYSWRCSMCKVLKIDTNFKKTVGSTIIKFSTKNDRKWNVYSKLFNKIYKKVNLNWLKNEHWDLHFILHV